MRKAFIINAHHHYDFSTGLLNAEIVRRITSQLEQKDHEVRSTATDANWGGGGGAGRAPIGQCVHRLVAGERDGRALAHEEGYRRDLRRRDVRRALPSRRPYVRGAEGRLRLGRHEVYAFADVQRAEGGVRRPLPVSVSGQGRRQTVVSHAHEPPVLRYGGSAMP